MLSNAKRPLRHSNTRISRINMQHQVVVVQHNGIDTHINRKYFAKQPHTLDQPNSAILKVLP
ncbi:hypothetical protein AB4230_22485 [Vibrio cyclitrophicus]